MLSAEHNDIYLSLIIPYPLLSIIGMFTCVWCVSKKELKQEVTIKNDSEMKIKMIVLGVNKMELKAE